MNKQEAVKDAQDYARRFGLTVYVLRRGEIYKSSRIEQKGWRIAEIVKA